MVYAGMNGMEGIGKAVLNGVGGDREKMGEEEEREVPADEENGVEVRETGKVGASGGDGEFEKVFGEKGAVRRRGRRDGLDEVKDRFGVV